MQQLYLGIFVASMAALVVTGCILTRKPRKKLPTETLRAEEEERGGNWKGSWGSIPAIKEAKPSL
jgi:hypothetical protein